jgi:mutator protein MutT
LNAVDIVVGIIFKDNKFLVEKRKAREKIDPGIVCLPGGHIELNETKEKALKREMKEELNIDIKKLQFIKKDFWIANNGEKQNIFYYRILDYEGKPICKEAKEIIWIENIEELNIESDRTVIEEIRKEKLKNVKNN